MIISKIKYGLNSLCFSITSSHQKASLLLEEHPFIKNRLRFFVPLFLIFLFGFYSFNHTLSHESVSGSDNRLNETDELVLPGSGNKIETFDKIISKKSLYNLNYFENLFTGWGKLFDLFAANPNLKQSSKTIDQPDLERVSEKVQQNVQEEFKLGNVENLVNEFGDIIKRECNYYQLDWRLVLAIIRQESYFNPSARSHAGAFGLMQIMPGTGAQLQGQLQLEETSTPSNNLIAGIYYYASLSSQFRDFGDDKYKFALAAYNAGIGRVIDAMTITAYFEKDYKSWEDVKEAYPFLHSSQDSVHALVWPNSKRPPYGTLDNWKEPYNYVRSIMFYYDAYKKLYASNLKEEKPKTKSKKKKKR